MKRKRGQRGWRLRLIVFSLRPQVLGVHSSPSLPSSSAPQFQVKRSVSRVLSLSPRSSNRPLTKVLFPLPPRLVPTPLRSVTREPLKTRVYIVSLSGWNYTPYFVKRSPPGISLRSTRTGSAPRRPLPAPVVFSLKSPRGSPPTPPSFVLQLVLRRNL